LTIFPREVDEKLESFHSQQHTLGITTFLNIVRVSYKNTYILFLAQKGVILTLIYQASVNYMLNIIFVFSRTWATNRGGLKIHGFPLQFD